MTRGRPRSAAAEESILRATIDLLAEGGPDATTIKAVAARSGVARATIYLRWPSRDQLILAGLRHAIGREPYTLTGDIERDLRGGADQARAILAQPLMARVLPVLVRWFLERGPGASPIAYERLFPNRLALAAEYDRLAGAQGFRADVRGEVAVDLVIGSLLNQLLGRGRPPTAGFSRQVVEVVLAGLRDDTAPPSAAKRAQGRVPAQGRR
jgi:AcrR family transcriptional regulator